MSDEKTDIDRRLLAHEHILETIVAYLVENDTGLLAHLHEAFGQPVNPGPDAFTDTAAYAARFMREVIRKQVMPPASGRIEMLNENPSVKFAVLRRDDMWEVLRDGKLCGGYISQKNALEAAHIAIQDIFCSGGSAELTASQSTVSK